LGFLFFQIFAVGVLPPVGTINEAELIDITGDPERVIIALEGYEMLDEEFAEALGNELCPPPCE